MTKERKIAEMLDWALTGAAISPQNFALLRTQFAAMSDAEVERRYAQMQRRRERLAA